MQNAGSITNATGIHRHLDNLLFDLRRLACIAIVQQKGAPASLSAFAAAIALLTLTGVTVSDDIGALAMGAVQYLKNHKITRLC